MLHNQEIWHNDSREPVDRCYRMLGCAIVLAVIKETQKLYRYKERARHAPSTMRNLRLVRHYSELVQEHIEWLMGDECFLYCGHRFSAIECIRICEGGVEVNDSDLFVIS